MWTRLKMICSVSYYATGSSLLATFNIFSEIQYLIDLTGQGLSEIHIWSFSILSKTNGLGGPMWPERNLSKLKGRLEEKEVTPLTLPQC